MSKAFGQLIGKIQNRISNFRTKNRYLYQSHTPKNNVNLVDYKEKLDHAFKSDSSKNIALFGAEGIGKSSIIETYKKQHSDVKFLHITLAHHKLSIESDKDNTEIKESVLEGKILNQLIHQINPKKIPLTKFRVKRESSRYNALVTVLLVMVLLVSVLHITNFPAWQGFVNDISENWIVPLKQILLFTASHEMQFFSGFVCFVILSIIVYRIVTDSKYRYVVRKVSSQGVEIELFLENEESYFDRYMNDVLYLFEKASVDIIVFEDLGKYFTIRIFQRLREINNLVNNRLHTPLRFLYLLPDDILNPEDREKLFDFSFSVNRYDSYDRLQDYFRKAGILKLFAKDEELLRKISSYANNTRLFVDVCNDFIGCLRFIDNQTPSYTKLLAVMIYKNRFPKDYKNSQSCKGFVYSLFSRIDETIQNKVIAVEVEISSLSTKIQNANNEPLKSKDELDIVYSRRLEQCRNMPPEKQEVEIKRLKDEKEKRKEYIENQNKERIMMLTKDIESLQAQKRNIQCITKLCEILSYENIGEIFERTYYEVKKETDFDIADHSKYELLKYLVLNGHIDETYKDYMYC